MDGVVKHLSESRDFEHRLRALENEVKSLLQHLLLMQKNIVCKDNNCPALRTEKCGYWELCLSSDGVLLKCSELDCRYFGTGQHVQTSSSSTHIKRCVWIPNTCVFNSFIWPKLTLLELFASSSTQMLSRLPPVLEQASVMPLLAQGHASLQSACWSLSNWTVRKYRLF